MTLGRTARDVPPRELLPLLAEYLKECGFAEPIHKCSLPESAILELESRVLDQLANVLFQLYLYPSLNIPGFAVPRGASRAQISLVKQLHRGYVQRLLQTGWVIKDVTGIYYLAPFVSSRIDECANAISK
jgi:hypothetical protein